MSVDASVPSQRHEWGSKGAKHSFLGTVISERARGRSGGAGPQGTELTRSVGRGKETSSSDAPAGLYS
ncbi:uncharacterized protein N7473_006062 [Penicillium subrubescens]|uniref:uncharacterized protein n=1 Tax=Penicillium subrubescens TaxID=1316194 RepID=UPI0025456DC1|nr:uncharacterized protein N7473_006062 [Penicillium subrubescens]KAJ5896663.1 hypothetical protein N7473_006062 [Penicillium subrubescens]